MSEYCLDTIDWKILNILQFDAGIANIELAEKVCLSPSPCSRRVKNLESTGYIIKRVTLLDPKKAGLPVTVFIQVTLHHQVKKDLDHFAEQVLDWRFAIVELHLSRGLRAPAHFIFQTAKGQALSAILNNQGRYALGAVIAGARHDDIGVRIATARDEGFGAGEAVICVGFHRFGFKGRCIGA